MINQDIILTKHDYLLCIIMKIKYFCSFYVYVVTHVSLLLLICKILVVKYFKRKTLHCSTFNDTFFLSEKGAMHFHFARDPMY